MKRTLITLGALAIGLGSIAAVEATDSKALFTSKKCSTCHSITSQGITKSNAASKAPDLQSVGKTRNAAWLAKYLQKLEAVNGKQHPVKVAADADLTTLTNWLATLKK